MTTQTTGHRFPIRISPISQALMIPFGVSRSRAFTQLADGKLHVRFGPMFDERVPLEDIKKAEVAHWPRWAGVGPRTDFRGNVGLVGSYDNTVKLTLKEPLKVNLFVVPVTCRQLYLSMEDAEGFLHEIREARTAQREHAKAA